MVSSFRRIVFAALTLAFFAASSARACEESVEGTFTPIVNLLPAFAAVGATDWPEEETSPNTKGCEQKPVAAASNREMFGDVNVNVWLREPKDPAKSKGTILIFPSVVGKKFVEDSYASRLCSLGYSVMITEYFKESAASVKAAELDPLLEHTVLKNVVSGTGHLIEWIKAHPGRFSPKIGVLGASLGGTFAAQVAANYTNDVKGGAFIAAGYDPADIFGRSEEKTVAAIREARMKRFGFSTTEEYSAFMRKIFGDVSLSGKTIPVDPDRFLFVVAGNDSTIPTDDQLRLVRAFGTTRNVYESGSGFLQGEHIQTILATWLFSEKLAVKFLDEQLKGR